MMVAAAASAGATLSTSASSKTRQADLPPNSSESFFIVGAAAAMIRWPVEFEPVKLITSTSRASTRWAATAWPSSLTRLTTPGGRPSTACSASMSAAVTREVWGAGLMTVVQPAANAGVSDLESLLPEGHRARLVWAYVERQDLSRFYAGIRAAEGGVGRAAIAPEILLALWLYATLAGVGSAREVSRLIDSHDAYRWLCGGVQVNHHTLSDFRKNHGEALDELLSLSIASLMAAGVVKLKQVAQDGRRVRASAGAGSFRRKEKLEGYLEAARARVGQLKAELEADPGQAERARQAARLRAAAERQARLEKAVLSFKSQEI